MEYGPEILSSRRGSSTGKAGAVLALMLRFLQPEKGSTMQINLVTTNPELLNDRVTGIQTALQADEATLAGQQAAFSSASQSTFRNIDSEVLLNFSGSTAITGSVAAIRGNTAIASGTTISSGFVYGTQGKLTIQGAPVCTIQDDTTLANIATSTKTVTNSTLTITGSVGTTDTYSYNCWPGN